MLWLFACAPSTPSSPVSPPYEVIVDAYGDTAAPPTPVRLYVGSGDGHVYVSDISPYGVRTEVDVEYAGSNPSFLALAPNGAHLYAVDEGSSELVAFAVDDGELTPLNRVPANGSGPAHLTVDATGRWVLAANYGSGTVTAVAIEPDGRLGAAASTLYTGAHAHQIVLDAANARAYVPNLGDDTVSVLTFDAATGALAPSSVLALPAGSGPRHLAFHPNGSVAYVINELASTVVAASVAPDGSLAAFQTVSTLAGDAPGNTAAELVVHPSGWVYGSNRGEDSLVAYEVRSDGSLGLVGHVPSGGATPRHFSLSPAGDRLFAGNQGDGAIAEFTVDAETGALDPAGTFAALRPAYVGAFAL